MLFVTTTYACWLLDTLSGRAYRFHQGRGVYYGITFDTVNCFVAARDAVYGSDRENQVNVVLSFDRGLRLVRSLRPPSAIRDVHQIFCDRGSIYVVSTYDDAVIRYQLAINEWSTWFPFPETQKGDRNQFHINSIHVNDDVILLAGSKPIGWMARHDRRILTSGATRHPLGDGTHNIWHQTGGIAVCSSNEGAVKSTNGAMLLVCKRGWLRGIAQRGDVYYFGVNQNLVRDVRQGSDASIVAVAADGKILRSYTFEGHGMIHDIRAAGTADPTHNGTVFNVEESFWRRRDDNLYQTRPTLVNLQV